MRCEDVSSFETDDDHDSREVPQHEGQRVQAEWAAARVRLERTERVQVGHEVGVLGVFGTNTVHLDEDLCDHIIKRWVLVSFELQRYPFGRVHYSPSNPCGYLTVDWLINNLKQDLIPIGKALCIIEF